MGTFVWDSSDSISFSREWKCVSFYKSLDSSKIGYCLGSELDNQLYVISIDVLQSTITKTALDANFVCDKEDPSSGLLLEDVNQTGESQLNVIFRCMGD